MPKDKQEEFSVTKEMTEKQKVQALSKSINSAVQKIKQFDTGDVELVQAVDHIIDAIYWLRKNHNNEGALGYRYKKKKNRLLTGVVVMTPLALTVWIIYTLFIKLDGLLAVVVGRLVGKNIPGSGVVALILLTLIIGIFARNFFGGKLITLGNMILARIPLVSKIYGAIRQITEIMALVDQSRLRIANGATRIATRFITLMSGLIAGPAVSLNGSPTVSPTIAAL